MQQYITKDEYLQVKEVLKSKLLSGFLASPEKFWWSKNEIFRKTISGKIFSKICHCIQSATAGIHALSACNLEPGDEVIVTPLIVLPYQQ